MLVQNNSAAPVTLNLRDGKAYTITAKGGKISLSDSYTALLDDNASTIALFNSGVLSALTDAGAAFPGFPTTVSAADSVAGKSFAVGGFYDANGNPTLSGPGAEAVLHAVQEAGIEGAASMLFVQNTAVSKTDNNTTEAVLASKEIQPSDVGPNDSIVVEGLFSLPSSATNKDLRVRIAGVDFMFFRATTSATFHFRIKIRFRNSLASQIAWATGSSNGAFGTTASAANVMAAIDFSTAKTLEVVAQWGTAGTGLNSITLEAVDIEIKRAPSA